MAPHKNAVIIGAGNLFLAGRNGMHSYNNQDASMLTAAAVECIRSGGAKDQVWALSNEKAYIEAGKFGASGKR